MRYLVFSDVHGNLEALNTVLAEGEQRGIDAYLFTGDLVGYGPNPLECIQRLIELEQRDGLAWVAGNHDLVARGEIQPDGYSVEALRTLEWTCEQLRDQDWAQKFLAKPMRTAQVNERIWMTHDSLTKPGGNGYHRDPQNARLELELLRKVGGTVCFYGHTHLMRAELFRDSAGVVLAPMYGWTGEGIDPHPLRVGLGELAWVSSGSTGFPTNRQRLAEYLILDDADNNDWRIEKYTVPYPRERTRARVEKELTSVCGEAVANRIVRWL